MKKFIRKLALIFIACSLAYSSMACATAKATFKETEALTDAKGFVNNLAISKQKVIEGLEELGYSEDEIEYAIKNCGANWKKEAVDAAKNVRQQDPTWYNEENLTAVLKSAGFTSEEAAYGAEQACK